MKPIGYALRVTQVGDGPETVEVRYYIASRYLSGKRFEEALHVPPTMHFEPQILVCRFEGRSTFLELSRLFAEKSRQLRTDKDVNRATDGAKSNVAHHA